MLVSIGEQAASEDVVDLLLACHERICRFTTIAHRLALSSRHSSAELREAAEQVRRYFTEALPLHVADEDAIASRLAGRSPEVDAMFATMAGQHAGHEPDLARLVAICDAIAVDPRILTTRGPELEALATSLEAEFRAHFALEERLIFPLLRKLPESEQAEIREEMRARR